MTIKKQHFTILQIICLGLYYCFAQYLPSSNTWLGIGGWTRKSLCKHIFKKCGKNVNIERRAIFGRGTGIELGDYSGIGINACIPGNTIIGDYVMMGPNCHILPFNHEFSDLRTPMMFQGFRDKQQTIIEDDVWIGINVTMTPGRHIKKGTIIGACTVLTKDFPEYSIVGGNPSKLIRSRKDG